MKVKIFKDNEWKTLMSCNPTPENKKRMNKLSSTSFGGALITTLMVNHELGLYDINEALDHLYKRKD